MDEKVSVSLTPCLWKRVCYAIHSDRASLLSKAKGVEGLYGDILKSDAQELSIALQEIDLNLSMVLEDAYD